MKCGVFFLKRRGRKKKGKEKRKREEEKEVNGMHMTEVKISRRLEMGKMPRNETWCDTLGCRSVKRKGGTHLDFPLKIKTGRERQRHHTDHKSQQQHLRFISAELLDCHVARASGLGCCALLLMSRNGIWWITFDFFTNGMMRVWKCCDFRLILFDLV